MNTFKISLNGKNFNVLPKSISAPLNYENEKYGVRIWDINKLAKELFDTVKSEEGIQWLSLKNSMVYVCVASILSIAALGLLGIFCPVTVPFVVWALTFGGPGSSAIVAAIGLIESLREKKPPRSEALRSELSSKIQDNAKFLDQGNTEFKNYLNGQIKAIDLLIDDMGPKDLDKLVKRRKQNLDLLNYMDSSTSIKGLHEYN